MIQRHPQVEILGQNNWPDAGQLARAKGKSRPSSENFDQLATIASGPHRCGARAAPAVGVMLMKFPFAFLCFFFYAESL